MGSRSLSCLEKCLIASVVCLVGAVIAVAVLYATKEPSPGHREEKIQVCTTQHCITAASDLLNAIDTTVQPCDDFFLYACGGWMKRNPLPSGKKTWDVSSKLKHQIDGFMKTNIVSLETRAHYSKVQAVMKGMLYYDSCLNTTLASSGAPVMSLVSQYGSCAALDPAWTDGAWDLTTTLAKMTKDLDIAGLFELDVNLDENNSSAYMITLQEPSQFRLTRADLTDASPTNRDAYRVYMKGILSAVGNVSDADVNAILSFEVEIAKIMDSSGYEPEYSRTNLTGLVAQLGLLQINWTNFLRGVFDNTGYSIDGNTVIVVHGMPFLKSLMALIQGTPKRTIANFLMWQIIDKFAIDFGKDNIALYNAFMKVLDKGSDYSAIDRKDFCFKRTMEINSFGMPLSRIFVDKKFSATDKKWIENMVDRIKGVFMTDLEANTWMDTATKKAAKEKAEATTTSIGYPSYLTDNAKLDALFADVTVDRTTYLDNTVSLKKSFTKRSLARVGKSKGNDQIAMTPVKVNAYYEDSFTRVVFPAAMLQPPFYDGNYTGALNYGAIGSTVGHELLHGFDNAGKDYDKNGNRAVWWTSDTLAKFKEKAECLTYQYSNYTFYGTQVNGKSSLSENIADNAGMMQSFQAYKLWKKEIGFEPRLPGTSFTSDQIFFISFAQSWCSIVTKEDAAAGYMTYSPTPWRVNGTLRNSPSFAQAFSCKSGAPMNPENKCSVW